MPAPAQLLCRVHSCSWAQGQGSVASESTWSSVRAFWVLQPFQGLGREVTAQSGAGAEVCELLRCVVLTFILCSCLQKSMKEYRAQKEEEMQ